MFPPDTAEAARIRSSSGGAATSVEDTLDLQELAGGDDSARGAPSAAAGDAYLLVIEDRVSRIVKLPRDGTLLLGRGARADVVLREPAVSRLHARLTLEGGVARVTDLGSHHGTYVDGARIGSTTRVSPGDVVTLPGTKLVLHTSLPAASPAAERDPRARIEPRRSSIGPPPALAADAGVLEVMSVIERLASTDLPVLVTGETGSGRELAASALHQGSKRRSRPLVALDCAALPEPVAELELFGHDEGAVPGVRSARAGLFELASGGTLLLDEVGELPMSVQAKLLRILDTRRVARLGELSREREVDVRIVAMTHRDLRAEVRAGRFRQDLFSRLSAATIAFPPLRGSDG